MLCEGLAAQCSAYPVQAERSCWAQRMPAFKARQPNVCCLQSWMATRGPLVRQMAVQQHLWGEVAAAVQVRRLRLGQLLLPLVLPLPLSPLWLVDCLLPTVKQTDKFVFRAPRCCLRPPGAARSPPTMPAHCTLRWWRALLSQ